MACARTRSFCRAELSAFFVVRAEYVPFSLVPLDLNNDLPAIRAGRVNVDDYLTAVRHRERGRHEPRPDEGRVAGRVAVGMRASDVSVRWRIERSKRARVGAIDDGW